MEEKKKLKIELNTLIILRPTKESASIILEHFFFLLSKFEAGKAAILYLTSHFYSFGSFSEIQWPRKNNLKRNRPKLGSKVDHVFALAMITILFFFYDLRNDCIPEPARHNVSISRLIFQPYLKIIARFRHVRSHSEFLTNAPRCPSWTTSLSSASSLSLLFLSGSLP